MCEGQNFSATENIDINIYNLSKHKSKQSQQKF
jgi:hypothetical protein